MESKNSQKVLTHERSVFLWPVLWNPDKTGIKFYSIDEGSKDYGLSLITPRILHF